MENRIEKIFSLTPLQEGILLHSLMEKNPENYFNQFKFNYNEELDINIFEQSVNILIKRHEILRTVFINEKLKKPKQVVLNNRIINVRFHDIANKKDKDKYLEEFEKNDRQKLFELSKDILIRFTAFKTGEKKYRIYISFHHIILDGWSLPLLVKELFNNYKRILNNLSINNSGPCIYSEYIKWICGKNTDKAMDYWKNHLSGLTGITGVPDIKNSVESFNRGEYSFFIKKESAIKIVSYTVNSHVTLNVFFQAVWALLLKYFNNTNDIIFGTVVSGRDPEFPGSENIIGLLLNTLPVRLCINPDDSFTCFLKSVQQNAIKLNENKNSSLAEIQTETGFKERLFDHLLVFENYPADNLYKSDDEFLKKISDLRMYETTNYDFNIIIMPGENIKINFIYNKNMIPDSYIRLVEKYILNIIDNVILDPDIPVKDILLKKDIENTDSSQQYTSADNIINIFEKKVSESMHDICLVYKDQKLTYEALNEKANMLAGTLANKGVKKGDIVGILVDRSFEMIIGILAVLKAGAAYLPLNPAYPKDRINYILNDCKCSCLLLQDIYYNNINFNNKINLNDNEIYSDNADNLNIRIYPDDLIYVTYTSGSTGNPKGVMIEHGSVFNILDSLNEIYPFEKKDAFLLKTAYTFDVSVVELFGWFFGNGILAILEQEYEKDPVKIIEAVKKYKITHINFVPSMLSVLIDTIDTDNINKLPSLKYIFAAGEAITRDIVEKLINTGISAKIENLYGPTEATIYTTKYSINKSGFPEKIPIGKTLPNIDFHIVNSENRIVPAGCIGELCFSGVCLSRGYHNRQELTDEKFNKRIHGFEKRVYRTGDIARELPDGNIDYMGRLDDQVKIRGNRIELGEISSVLGEHPDIKEAYVIAKTDKNGFKYLGAYYTGSDNLMSSDLSRFLHARLPSYMIPDYYIHLKEIPLNASGKLDRKKLPEPQGNKKNKHSEIIAPRNEIEENILEIWHEVLGLEQVSIHDNFFDLGGNSLKAIQVFSQLKPKYEIKISDLFEYETIAELAKHIHKSKELFYEMAESLKTVTFDRISILSTFDYEKSVKKYEAQYNFYNELKLKETINYSNILLTGATGYLGIHILHDLLIHTNSHITIFVRGNSNEEAKTRFGNKYRFYFNKNIYEEYSKRITVLKADIALDNFGLDKKTFNKLAGSIDCIVNSAANVKHYGRMSEFTQVNVLGVEKLIDFADYKIKKIIHHISTVSIGLSELAEKDYFLFTEFDRIDNNNISNPYLKTKINAEEKLFKAQKKGIIVNIYRMGNIVFNTETNKFQENIGDNAFYKSIKSYIKLKKFPQIKFRTYDFTYVDYSSRAFTLLFNKKELMNEVFHITNPNYISISAIGSFIKDCGYDIKIVKIEKFKKFLSDYDKFKTEKQFILNLILHSHILDNPHLSGFIHKNTKSNLLLKKMGFEWENVNINIIKKMLDYCESVHFL